MRSNNTIKPQSVHPPVHDGFSHLLRQSYVDENGRAKSCQAAIHSSDSRCLRSKAPKPSENALASWSAAAGGEQGFRPGQTFDVGCWVLDVRCCPFPNRCVPSPLTHRIPRRWRARWVFRIACGDHSFDENGRVKPGQAAIQRVAGTAEHPTSNIQHRTSNIEHPTSNIQ